ncbi:ABC transporter transmembrane domain-containing protein [Pacificimonas flava]|uniref:ABC-type multidrug transport system ATPase component n=1 Tax=Pacificimonas flava TaxID=1234595 RepID=M2TKL7_9SPHN|nr:ABC transporter transmembrane domain-containing protein [Pacificimonas flava]EMD82211.1 ABC-type multidrug transport system ATPase component [Pacificimonas flava]MBB5280311.1 ATP-binding cassette subfamily B protein [Pacificimonas flava]
MSDTLQDSRTLSGEDAPKRLSKLRLIWDFARRYPGHLAAALLALIVSATATLAIPQGLKLIVDRGFGNDDPSAIAPYFAALLGVVVVLAAATAIRFYFVSWLGERVVADLRRTVHAHLLSLDPGFFEENRPSEIASRLTADTSVIEQVVGTSFSVTLRNLFMGTGGILYLLYLSPKLTGMMMLVIPLTIAPIVFFGRKVRTLSRTSLDRIADVGALVSETLGAIRIVQAFTQEARESRRFGAAVDEAFTAAKRRIAIRAVMTSLVILLIFGAITLVLWEGAVDVITGGITGGTITAFIFASALVAGAFGALTETYSDIMRGAGAAGRMAELLEQVPAIRPPDQPHSLPSPAAGALRFEDVEFRYPTKPDSAAVHGLTLDVRPGETVAIVGPSGAGKSTLFGLIQRFYDPQAGSISVDGVRIEEAAPADLRARLSVVPQETVVFAATARDNIAYGRPDASEGEIWAAAEAANAAAFLRELPQGLDTFLGEAGTRLSGGQRQRIAIARAILRDAPILLLDEATSALDAQSEREVQQALERLMQGRTTLVIAHRLATVRGADRIVVMDGGRIVAEGRHDELVAAGGLYARLARLQFDDAA